MIMHVPIGIERVIGVRESADRRRLDVRIAMMPPRASIPSALRNAASYTVLLDDPERTALTVLAVSELADATGVEVTIALPPQASSGRFTVQIDGLVPGLDIVGATWGGVPATVDPGDRERAPLVVSAAPPTLSNYLYRDYASFKQLMTDVVRNTLPRLRETHEADAGVAMIDVLAYAADHLAYFQDAVATEAYLTTARRRVSIRRHVRMLSYNLFEGSTSRLWLHVRAERRMTIEPGFRFPITSDTGTDANVYQALARRVVEPAVNDMDVWDFDGVEPVLAAGSTTAVLDVRASANATDALLREGDVLVFEQRFESDAPGRTSLQHRQLVRLRKDGITFPHPHRSGRLLVQATWHPDDALTRSYDLRRAADGSPATIVHGNMIPADFGETFEDPTWYEADDRGIVRAFMPNVIYAIAYDPGAAGIASEIRSLRPYNALPQITAVSYPFGIERRWYARQDLIGADPSERAFVVETERNGSVIVRFGDGVNGTRPAARTRFRFTYRRGFGPAGQIGPDAVGYTALLAGGETDEGTRYSVRNPLASYGYMDQQDADRARRAAPELIRFARPKRCIADDDFAVVARAVPGVRAVAVRRRWTGSGATVQVYVDGTPPAAELEARVRAALESTRVMCTRFNVRGPRVVGLYVAIRIVGAPRTSRTDLLQRVSASVAQAVDEEGLTLGSTVYLSWFVSAAMRAPGVVEADVQEFRRFGAPDAKADGFIAFPATEKPTIVDERGIATGSRPTIVIA